MKISRGIRSVIILTFISISLLGNGCVMECGGVRRINGEIKYTTTPIEFWSGKQTGPTKVYDDAFLDADKYDYYYR